ncbi:MAG TPA: hypothetical protein VJM12_11500 [Pyrinomonadaceae bacterium]|nr:hypothetical protein [Pyrinomonadaceae bacterium]
MKALLVLPLLVLLLPTTQNPITSTNDSQVSVLGFKWTKGRLTLEQAKSASVPPAEAMIPANRNFERNRRINDPAGVRDPNLDTLDGRRAAMDRNVEESRTQPAKSLDGYRYRVKLQNASSKVIEVLFWEYQFKEIANPSSISRRQFLCGVNIKPGKDKEIQAFSLSGPTDVISVASLSDKSKNLFQEGIVINRVEFSDGSIWQRKDWNFGEIRLSYQRAIATPWSGEMCRGL